jgi:hypothetical protein
MAPTRLDLTGQAYGLLTALAPTDKRQDNLVVWRCQCRCGSIALVNTNRLRVGAVKSCGCLNRQPVGGRPRAVCTVRGCGVYVKGHGLCSKHLARQQTHGATVKRVRPVKLCSVAGCGRVARAKALCNMHRIRLRFHGDPGEATPRRGLGGTGSISPAGYRYLYRPSHPNAAKNGNVAEHVVIMAQMIGRALRKGESVHHRNGIRADNRPENLELRTTATHPAGQSVADMLEFCQQYIAEYAPLREALGIAPRPYAGRLQS